MTITAALTFCLLIGVAPEIPRRAHEITIDIDGVPLELFTYKPDSYRDGPLILVFHGAWQCRRVPGSCPGHG